VIRRLKDNTTFDPPSTPAHKAPGPPSAFQFCRHSAFIHVSPPISSSIYPRPQPIASPSPSSVFLVRHHAPPAVNPLQYPSPSISSSKNATTKHGGTILSVFTVRRPCKAKECWIYRCFVWFSLIEPKPRILKECNSISISSPYPTNWYSASLTPLVYFKLQKSFVQPVRLPACLLLSL
jgi:hypothetical protein